MPEHHLRKRLMQLQLAHISEAWGRNPLKPDNVKLGGFLLRPDGKKLAIVEEVESCSFR